MKKIVITQMLVIALSVLYPILFGMNMAYITWLTLLLLLYSLVINERENRKLIYAWVIIPIIAYVSYKITESFEHPLLHSVVLWRMSIHFTFMLMAYVAGFFLSRCNAKIVRLAILITSTIALFLIGNMIGWALCFMTTGLVFLVAPYIAYRYISQESYIPLIIVAPITLLNLLTSDVLLLTIVPLCGVGVYYLAFLLRRRRVVLCAMVGLYTMVLVYGWYKGFEDYCQWQSVKEARLPADASVEYTFYDIDGQAVTSETLKGKVVVFDFWSTSCGVCFREFPKFEEVYQKYQHRDDIAFYAVNLPTKGDTKERIRAMTAQHVNYSFPVLFADETSDYWTQFNITGVPHLMIFDREGGLSFSGWANYERKIVYNIESMIDRLLK